MASLRVAANFWPDGLRCLYMAFFHPDSISLPEFNPELQLAADKYMNTTPLARLFAMIGFAIQAIVFWFCVASLIQNGLPWWFR